MHARMCGFHSRGYVRRIEQCVTYRCACDPAMSLSEVGALDRLRSTSRLLLRMLVEQRPARLYQEVRPREPGDEPWLSCSSKPVRPLHGGPAGLADAEEVGSRGNRSGGLRSRSSR